MAGKGGHLFLIVSYIVPAARRFILPISYKVWPDISQGPVSCHSAHPTTCHLLSGSNQILSSLQSAASLIICHCRRPAINNMLSFSTSRQTVLLTIKATLRWTISEQVEDFALAIILSCNYGSYENYVFAVGCKSERPEMLWRRKKSCIRRRITKDKIV